MKGKLEVGKVILCDYDGVVYMTQIKHSKESIISFTKDQLFNYGFRITKIKNVEPPIMGMGY